MKGKKWIYGLMIGGACIFIVRPSVGASNVVPVVQGLNLIAFPFQEIPAARGVVTANSDTTITDGGASWVAGYFNAGVTGSEATGNSTFYIETANMS